VEKKGEKNENGAKNEIAQIDKKSLVHLYSRRLIIKIQNSKVGTWDSNRWESVGTGHGDVACNKQLTLYSLKVKPWLTPGPSLSPPSAHSNH
jgi:hypothetical protein